MASAAHTLSVLVDLFPLSFRLSAFHALHPYFPIPPHCALVSLAWLACVLALTAVAPAAPNPRAQARHPPPHARPVARRQPLRRRPPRRHHPHTRSPRKRGRTVPPRLFHLPVLHPRAPRAPHGPTSPHQRSRRLRAVPDQTSDPATSTSSNTSTPNSPRSSPPSPRAVAPPVARGLSSSPSITANSSATTATSAVAGRLRCGSLYSTPPPVGSARC